MSGQEHRAVVENGLWASVYVLLLVHLHKIVKNLEGVDNSEVWVPRCFGF